MNAEVVFNLFFTAILLLVFLGALRLLESGKREARTVFFAFAVASVLLSNLYWLAYDILRPGTRMPFAANEIGEWALFLLLGAALHTQSEVPSAKREVFCAALFTAANVALWIAWSGEWIQDVLTGAAFGYFLCSLVAQIKLAEVFPAWEWRLFGISCPVLVAMQTAIFFIPEPVKQPLDLFCYCLLFTVAAVLLIRAFQTLRSSGQPSSAVLEAFAAFAWASITQYMSSGWFYIAALVLSTLCFPLMLLALRKEVAAG
ncbi:MAG: hypothetical protein IJ237_07940 [Oscillospiraceae bacterium]|nr:hypothetical protein [Oscillospiraceae bacterium]